MTFSKEILKCHHVDTSKAKEITPELKPVNVTNLKFGPSGINSFPNTSVKNEKFLTYLPHSQFHNQLIELKNAIVLAYLTNRTLIMPPILHFTDSLAFPYEPLHNLYNHLNYVERVKKNRLLCNIKDSRRRYCSPKFSKYDSFMMINWEEIFDFSWIKSQIKIINKNELSIEGLYKICNIPAKETTINEFQDLYNNENVYVISQGDKLRNRYYYRFFDTDNSDNNYDLDNYKVPYLISNLRKREEKLIHTDSLFGSFRIKYEDERVIKWRSDMMRSLKVSHPILLDVTNNIVNELSGVENFLGVHVRTGDGIFKSNMGNTIDLIIEDMKNIAKPTKKMMVTSDSENHSLNNCKLQNERIIFIATDSSNPREELTKIFLTFPCVFTLGDFEEFIYPLRNYTLDRNIKMLNFFYPLLDLLIIANGMDVIGTPNSTFSKFAIYYHEILTYDKHSKILSNDPLK
ncbi:hypothetical protein C1645_817135 [Glomus cerebriforme]|uniref:Ciga protein n=1 Tax=Glomus cerebriforme TaxID=658196 RepID=A0A397TCU0_9GLOM|nr:hypothetical protein C1645_817135 [Glomus cerebriforme]